VSALGLRCPKCQTPYRVLDWYRRDAHCPNRDCQALLPKPPRYIVGLDLGQAADYTAVTILEEYPAGYNLRYLHRFDIGTPYPVQVAGVLSMLGQDPLLGLTELVVDHTGVGRPVVDMLRARGLSPICVTITGGDALTLDSNDASNYRVPKRDLVGALVVLFQEQKLRIARGVALGAVFTKELLNFKMKINVRTGHDSYEAWREGEHDDLVLAVALAAWWGERGGDVRNFLGSGLARPSGQPAAPHWLPAGAVLVGGGR